MSASPNRKITLSHLLHMSKRREERSDAVFGYRLSVPECVVWLAGFVMRTPRGKKMTVCECRDVI
jgi:hypothetical protein